MQQSKAMSLRQKLKAAEGRGKAVSRQGSLMALVPSVIPSFRRCSQTLQVHLLQCQTQAKQTAPFSLRRAEVPCIKVLAGNRIWKFAAP